MRLSLSFILGGAVAAVFAGGCEVHEHDRGTVAVTSDVAVDEPQGAVVDDPSVVAIDVEPDPAQRVYVYDEGYPPGTYIYNNYYYYGGYRYPHDIFVNRYVQENIRQRRFINREENQRQAVVIEQRHRTEFSQTHGVRQARPAGPAVQPHEPQPVHQPAPRPDVERPENKRPPVEEHRVNPAENHAPSNAEHHEAVERPDNRGKPANEEHRPGNEEPRHEEGK